MGTILALPGCAASLACCCGSAACGLCCNACPSCANSTTTRIMYALMLLVGMVTSCIMLIPSLQKKLGEGIFKKICDQLGEDLCEKGIGYQGVYRVCFAMVIFFMLMWLIMLNVKTSKDGRSKIQNGFWFFKYLILTGITVGAFFFPPDFSTVWMYFGLIGAGLFILFQLVMVVDFACGVAETLLGKAEESDSPRKWYALLLVGSLLCYGVAIALVVIGFVYYTQAPEGISDNCGLHKFFISFNLILCVVVSIISILPQVQERLPHSGVFQSSCVSAYVMYMTWSAMSNDDNKNCTWDYTTVLGGGGSGVPIPANVIGMFIFWGLVLYSSIRNSSHSSLGKITGGTGATDGAAAEEGEAGEDKKKGAKVFDNEEEGVNYSYSMFHLLLALGSCYVMMSLTNWIKPEGSDTTTFNSNPGSMWVKIASAWISVLIYVWSLVAPMILSNREF